MGKKRLHRNLLLLETIPESKISFPADQNQGNIRFWSSAFGLCQCISVIFSVQFFIFIRVNS